MDVCLLGTYAVPIINTVFMFSSVAEDEDTTKTMLTTAIILVRTNVNHICTRSILYPCHCHWTLDIVE